MGTCASYGGIPAAPPNPTAAVGLQFEDGRLGGLLGQGLAISERPPVVNVAGCAVDADTMLAAMRWLLAGVRIRGGWTVSRARSPSGTSPGRR